MFNSPRRRLYELIADQCNKFGFFSNVISIRESIDSDKKINIHVISSKSLEQITNLNTDHTPLYFLHGTSNMSCRYIDIMNRFSREYTCIAIDLPGYGVSDNPSWINEENPEKLAVNVAYVINQTISAITGKQKVTIIGHSIGSYFTIWAIYQNPDLYKNSIMVSSPGVFPTLSKYGYYWGLIFTKKIPFKWYSHPLLSYIFYPILWARFNLLYAEYWCNNYSHDVNYLCQFIKFDQNKCVWILPNIQKILALHIPMAFVYGKSDMIVPIHQSHVLSRIHKHVHIYTVKSEGHSLVNNTNLFEKIMRHELGYRRDYNASEPCKYLQNNIDGIDEYGDCWANQSISESEKNYKKFYQYILSKYSSDHIIENEDIDPGIELMKSISSD